MEETTLGQNPTPAQKPKFNKMQFLVDNERELLSKYHFAVDQNRRLWYYSDGRYLPGAIENLLVRWVKQKWGVGIIQQFWDPSHAHRIAQSIASDCPTLWTVPPALTQINVENGILEWTGTAWILREHSPGWLSPLQLPIKYDPSAKCPHWDSFIADTFPDDNPDLPYQLLAWLAGPYGHGSQVAVNFLGETGAEGKSTAINAICAFLGPTNYQISNLHSLQSNRFSTAYLQGRLALICPDLPTTVMRETETFKKIVTCDEIQAEYKGGAQFQFRPFCKVLTASNRMPTSLEGGTGWSRRWYNVSFHKTITAKRSPAEMEARLHHPRELSGVLNKVLSHFIAIQSSGIALPTRAAIDPEADLAQHDPVYGWISQTFRVEPGATIAKPDVYQRYKLWCEKREQAPMSSNALSYAINRYFPVLPKPERGPRDHAGFKPYHWINLTYR